MIINPYLVQPGVPPFTGLLDTYTGAAAAYSAARRLSSTYTGSLIRVRRSSDNAEQDIGYTAGNVLDESALTTFVGGGNEGFVTTIYDQSGNAKNANQTTASYQPRIVANAFGSHPGGITKILGKPSIYFSSDDGYQLDFSSGSYTAASAFTVFQSLGEFTISTRTSGSSNHTPFSDNQTYDGFFMTSRLSLAGNASGYQSSGGALLQQINNGTSLQDHYNNNISTNSVSGTFVKPSAYRIAQNIIWGAYGTNGYCSENILWLSDQSSNRTGINTNINTFYSIY